MDTYCYETYLAIPENDRPKHSYYFLGRDFLNAWNIHGVRCWLTKLES